MTLALAFATIDRPYAAERLIMSVRRFFPDIVIYVADQSDGDGPFAKFCESNDVRRLILPYDCGVSVSRNALVDAITEDYFVLCDDDFILTEQTSFDGALHILNNNPDIGIVGGFLCDITENGQHSRHWEILLNYDLGRRSLTAIPIQHYAPTPEYSGPYPYFRCDAVMNFAVMRTSIFSETIRWDPKFLCNGEHEDFYLNIKQNSDIGIAYHPGMRADHHHIASSRYHEKRLRNVGWRQFLEKWNIDQHLDLTYGLQTREDPGVLTSPKELQYKFYPDPNKSTKSSVGRKRTTMTIDERGHLVPRYPATQVDRDIPDFGSVLVGPPGDIAENHAVSNLTPDAVKPMTAEQVHIFTAFNPFQVPGAEETLWLRIESRDDRSLPMHGVRLDLRFRWRVGDQYLNWSGAVTKIDIPDGMVPDWIAVLANRPFTLGAGESVELEIWDGTGERLFTICHFETIPETGAVALQTNVAPYIGHTLDMDQSAKSATQTKVPVVARLNSTNSQTNLCQSDVTGYPGAVWTMDAATGRKFVLPSEYPYDTARLIFSTSTAGDPVPNEITLSLA